MTFKETLKSVLEHLKSKWFVYFAVILALILVWFILVWGQVTKVPKHQALYVWTTPNENGTADNFLEVTDIKDYLSGSKQKYGYKKYEEKMEYANLGNDNQLNTFTWYADSIIDIFFMPTKCYNNDSLINPDNGEEYTELEIMRNSNTNYNNRFIDLYELLDVNHKDYALYQSLLADLSSRGLIVGFVGIDANKQYLPIKHSGIKINEDYVLSISKYYTLNSDTIYSLLYDITKDL